MGLLVRLQAFAASPVNSCHGGENLGYAIFCVKEGFIAAAKRSLTNRDWPGLEAVVNGASHPSSAPIRELGSPSNRSSSEVGNLVRETAGTIRATICRNTAVSVNDPRHHACHRRTVLAGILVARWAARALAMAIPMTHAAMTAAPT
jgi:hypothetical protein